jgi:hypothetical protein
MNDQMPATPGEEEVELELEDEVPSEEDGSAAPAAPAEPAASVSDIDNIDLGALPASTRGQIEALLRRQREEAAARLRAEQDLFRMEQALQQARAEQFRLRTQTEQLDAAVVQQHKARIEAEQSRLRDELARAVDDADAKAQFEIAQRISRLEIDAERVRLAESRLARQAQAQTMAREPVSAPAQPEARPAVDPKARDWALRNKWFGEDPILTSVAYGIHYQLVNEGISPTSDTYYQELDKRIQPFTEARMTKPSAPAPRPTLASGGASASLAPSRGKKTIRLTAQQQQTAQALGVSLQDYARELARLQNGG